MSAHTEISRIGWLSASLSTQKHRVMTLLGRIGDLRATHMMKPALFHKLLNLMGQVAIAKDEEVRILSAIEAIEQKHRFSRKEGKLKHPKPANTNDALAFGKDKECDEEYEEYCRKLHLRDTASESDIEDEDQGLMYNSTIPPKRPSYGWLWFMAFWLFMTTSSNAPNKNQSLKAD